MLSIDQIKGLSGLERHRYLDFSGNMRGSLGSFSRCVHVHAASVCSMTTHAGACSADAVEESAASKSVRWPEKPREWCY